MKNKGAYCVVVLSPDTTRLSKVYLMEDFGAAVMGVKAFINQGALAFMALQELPPKERKKKGKKNYGKQIQVASSKRRPKTKLWKR